MSEHIAKTATPRRRATFRIGESSYELVSVQEMTWPELRVLKSIAGMSPVKAEEGLLEADPDAWFAFAFVSIRRTAPQLTRERLEQMLQENKLVAIMESLEAGEMDPPLPPEPAPTSVEPTSTGAEPSGEPTQLSSTPATSGLPVSST